MTSKRCTIIGDASLTFECIKYLYHNAYFLLVISSNSLIKNWCQRHNIQNFESLALYESFDHISERETILLSIVNYQILSEKFIKRFRLAVNYHDSLLPKYSGLYATTWAILNKEKIHGISWHIIQQELDSGGIILSRRFSVEQKETAFSLNLKCTNEALLSFPLLMEKIENQNITEQKQDLSKRTYYSRDSIVAAHALISFADHISYIDRVLRAFHFHKELFNPLSFPKICINQQTFLLSDTEVTNKRHNASCGTLIENNAKYLEVAVNGGTIILKKVTTVYGKELTLLEFIKRSNLEINSCITEFDELEYRSAKISESFWLYELANFRYLDRQIIEPCKQYYHHSSYKTNRIIQLIKHLKNHSILYSNKNLYKFSKANYELYSSFIPITIKNSLSLPSNDPILSDLFVRAHFNKHQFPLLVISENVNILEKLPFYSFVLITSNANKMDVIEHNARFHINLKDLKK